MRRSKSASSSKGSPPSCSANALCEKTLSTLIP
jgi:hypothetical protein